VANTMVQKFWDSALALHPAEEHDWHRFVLFSILHMCLRS
jgi:hypothetical protein